eukprot:TRINITY_DN7783_c0_g1_i7.p1 TRINITY_DN7783_c0_g1~~TRINITY_DN7783_c0_g1_i7.p1  ORF type:complete len:180 (-),score=3.46 TRINITY_DN7783_c0_g1_i7:149-688(-)
MFWTPQRVPYTSKEGERGDTTTRVGGNETRPFAPTLKAPRGDACIVTLTVLPVAAPKGPPTESTPLVPAASRTPTVMMDELAASSKRASPPDPSVIASKYNVVDPRWLASRGVYTVAGAVLPKLSILRIRDVPSASVSVAPLLVAGCWTKMVPAAPRYAAAAVPAEERNVPVKLDAPVM